MNVKKLILIYIIVVAAAAIPFVLWGDIALAHGFGGWVNDTFGQPTDGTVSGISLGEMLGFFAVVVLIVVEAIAAWLIYATVKAGK